MSASNAELLAHAFADWGKDNPANMRDLLHPDCELVMPGSMRPTRRDQAGPGGRRCSCSYRYHHRYHAHLVTPLAGSREPRKARLESGRSPSRGDWI